MTYDRAQAATAKGVRAPRTGVVSGRVLVQGVGRVWSVRKEAGKLQIQLRCLNAHCLANSVMAKHLDAEVERRVMTWQTKAKGLKFNRSYPTGDGTDPAAKLEAAEYAMTQFLDNLEAISIIGQERWNAQAAKYQAVVDKARAMVMAQASEHDAEVSFTRLGDRWSDATIPERRS